MYHRLPFELSCLFSEPQLTRCTGSVTFESTIASQIEMDRSEPELHRKRKQSLLPGAPPPTVAKKSRGPQLAQHTATALAAAAAEDPTQALLLLAEKKEQEKAKRKEKMQRKRGLGLRFEWFEGFSWLTGELESGDSSLIAIATCLCPVQFAFVGQVICVEEGELNEEFGTHDVLCFLRSVAPAGGESDHDARDKWSRRI